MRPSLTRKLILAVLATGLLAACQEQAPVTIPLAQMPAMRVSMDGAPTYAGARATGMITINIQGFMNQLGRQRRVLATVGDVAQIKVSVKAEKATEYHKVIDRADLESGQTNATFTGLVPGPVVVTMRAFNAAGALIGTASQPTQVVPGEATVMEMTLTLDPSFEDDGVASLPLGTLIPTLTVVGATPTPAATPTPDPAATPTPLPSATPTPAPSTGASVVGSYSVAGEARAVALDAAGNAWVAHRAQDAGYPALSQLSSSGALLKTINAADGVGLDPSDLAIDTAGNVVVAGEGAALGDAHRGFVSKFTPDGTRLFAVSVDVGKKKIVLDGAGNTWIVNQRAAFAYQTRQVDGSLTYLPESHSVIQVSPDGALINTFGFTTPVNDVAIGPSGNVWVSHGTTTNGKVTRLTPAGAVLAVHSMPAGLAPHGLTFDAAGYAWIAAARGGTVAGDVVKMSTSGLIWGSYAVGVTPKDVAIDAAGQVWVANAGSGTISLLASNGAAIATFQTGLKPEDLASGVTGVWSANTGANTVTRIQ